MSEHAECLYHAWSCSSDNVGADETNPAASGSTACSNNLFCRLTRSPEKDSGTMLTQNSVRCQHGARVFHWASGKPTEHKFLDHSMRQLQLQAVTQWDSQWDWQWDSQWDLLHVSRTMQVCCLCLRKHLGKNGTGDSGATDPKWGLVCDFFMQGYKPALQIGQYQLPHSEGPMPTCRPYHRSDWIEFVCWLFEQLDS